MEDPHGCSSRLRAFLGRRRGDAVLLGEVNLPPRSRSQYFGDDDGDELTCMFDFHTMQAMYLSLARGEPGPWQKALAGRPAITRGSRSGRTSCAITTS